MKKENCQKKEGLEQMNIPDRATVERVRTEYPPGTKVELLSMDDVHAPPVGTIGEVLAVDDAASLIMRWQNGSGLNVLFGIDCVRKIDSQ